MSNNKINSNSYYISGDVGGTNCRLALVESVVSATEINGRVDLSHEDIVASKVYSSNDFNDFESILHRFYSEFEIGSKYSLPIVAAFGIAGPVIDNKSTITNLNWHLNGDALAIRFQLKKCILLNDFVAIGYGLLALDESKDLIQLNPSIKIKAKAPIACIGAGTGLGFCFGTWSGAHYNIYGAEGGHASFSPQNLLHSNLMEFLKQRLNIKRIGVERVVSGTGLPYIYEFFTKIFPQRENKNLSKKIKNAKYPGAIINQNVDGDFLCRQTIDLFIECYAVETGDLALRCLPYGGLYVAGGIVTKMTKELLKDDIFLKQMIKKGRLTDVVKKIPVFFVNNGDVGTLGSRVLASRLLKQYRRQRTHTSKL